MDTATHLTYERLLPPVALADPGRAAALLPLSALLRINFVPGLRQRLNWRGMRECPHFPDSLTARVAGRAGIYGLTCLDSTTEEGIGRAEFSLAYFPAPEDESLDGFAVEACLAVLADGYIDRVRDFPAHPDLCGLFRIATLEFRLDLDGGVALRVEAPDRAVIVACDGLTIDTSEGRRQAVEPGGCDKDLAAFDFAMPFVEALAASIGHALGATPCRLLRHTLPGQRWFYDAAGAIAAEPAEDIREIRLVLGWGDAPPLAEAPAGAESELAWTAPEAPPAEYAGTAWWRADEVGARHSLDKTALGIQDLPKLIVLTGFLGSGKTSFLSRFIEYQAARNSFVAVVQNEIGEKGLDGNLLGQHYAVAEVDEGCVCCTLAGSLKMALSGILRDYQPDFVVLETTGLANPANLLAEIAELEEHLTFASITTVVDARLGVSTLGRYAVARDQVRLADVILLNKAGDVAEADLRALEAAIGALNPAATIHRADHGDISPAALYGVNAAARRPAADPGHECCGAHDHDHAHDHHACHHHGPSAEGHTHAHDGLGSRLWAPPAPIDGDTLRQALSALPPGVLRVKGLVDLAGEAAPHLCQYVPGSFTLAPSSPSESEGKDRFLVLIGEDIDTAARDFIQAVET